MYSDLDRHLCNSIVRRRTRKRDTARHDKRGGGGTGRCKIVNEAPLTKSTSRLSCVSLKRRLLLFRHEINRSRAAVDKRWTVRANKRWAATKRVN